MNSDLLWRKMFGSYYDWKQQGFCWALFKLCVGLPQHPKPSSHLRRSPFSIISIWEISWIKEILKQSAICGSIYFPAILTSKAARSENDVKCSKAAVGPTGVGSHRPREEGCCTVWPSAWHGTPLDDTAKVSSGAFQPARKKVCSGSLSSYGKSQETWGLMQTSVKLSPAAWEKTIDFLAPSLKAG